MRLAVARSSVRAVYASLRIFYARNPHIREPNANKHIFSPENHQTNKMCRIRAFRFFFSSSLGDVVVSSA